MWYRCTSCELVGGKQGVVVVKVPSWLRIVKVASMMLLCLAVSLCSWEIYTRNCLRKVE